jgi:molybdopterin-guanine dinucleotide biosynthesis protein
MTNAHNDQVQKALYNFISTNEHSLLIIGPSGSGKTHICNEALQKWAHEYLILRPDYNEFSVHKAFKDTITNFLKVNNITQLLCKKRKLLFLDDVDILFNNDRYASCFIKQILKESFDKKILLTCSCLEERKISDIRKLIDNIVYIQPPQLEDILECLTNHHIDTTDKDKLKDLAETFQYNMRACMLNIHMSDEHVEDHVLHIDKNICDLVHHILTKPLNLQQLDYIISTDPVLISYIMYDNFYKFLNKKLYTHTITPFLDITKTFATCSLLETQCKNDQNILDICNLCKCMKIKQYHMSQTGQVLYTTILNKLTTYYSNIKRINELQSTSHLSYAAILANQSDSIEFKNKPESFMRNFTKKICRQRNE